MFLLIYAEASGEKTALLAQRDADFWTRSGNSVSDLCISVDNVNENAQRIAAGKVERLFIYGDVITDEIMRLVVAAFDKGIQISRCSFKWKQQPVCRGCIYRENDGERYVKSTYSCCTYHLKHNEFRKAPPLGDWCPYKKKRKG